MSINLKTIDNFLSNEECDELIKRSEDKLTDSTVGLNGEAKIDDSRKSKTYSLCNCVPFEQGIRKKVVEYLGIEDKKLEAIQLQKYEVGGYFNEHHDAFEGENLYRFGLASGNRVATLMVFLNDNSTGATHFPRLNQQYLPKKGMALYWDNLNKDGSINRDSLHAGLEVTEGKKYILTCWVRENNFDNVLDKRLFDEYVKGLQRNKAGIKIPQYSKSGYNLVHTPKGVLEAANEVLQLSENHTIEDSITKDYLPKGQTKLYPLDYHKQQRDTIVSLVKPMLENWVGMELELTSIFGIREYGIGSRLLWHKDREHLLISATIPVQFDVPWNLEVEDNNGDMIDVDLKVGEMLFYEGALRLHGRNTRFRGKSYKNMYVHFAPKYLLEPPTEVTTFDVAFDKPKGPQPTYI